MSRAALRGWLAVSAGIGAAVWAGAVALHPPGVAGAEWRGAVLAFAALVVVPLMLRLVPPEDGGIEAALWRAAALLQLPAALALLLAAGPPRGAGAALWTLPWLAETGLVALYGLARLRTTGFRLAEVCVSAGLAFLAVGGGWTVLARMGARPLGFSDAIVQLTAVHFHYAGLALPVLAGLAARELGGRTARLAAAGVIAGVPLTAVGITATQTGAPVLVETAAALLTAASGMLVAWLHLRLAMSGGWPPASRVLWAVSALSLAFGMALAAAYGSRAFISAPFLNIPWMQALHGTANAFGFATCGVLGWSLAGRRSAGSR